MVGRAVALIIVPIPPSAGRQGRSEVLLGMTVISQNTIKQFFIQHCMKLDI